MNIMKAVKVAVLVVVAVVAIKIIIGFLVGTLSMVFTAAVIIGGIYLLYSIFKS
ncbi:hypothetical protein Fleli_2591 [Bernardetia litoralis DSM 6794]|uniref:Uncharacterized protein n=1 Tax=Bernardetia litoralis (strain ATCC 23117 / DSM 6794 / NBRC 15988 / NCIMB 1366 / Fx l1 / Sio-4) TaxID=880071 RepID=I4ALW9_BERLS|nr:hypothetical protein [Bernardetia litoralis]AFM04954.1 hypothetical protein Fleli_2591 [Bernardetia litoralis DSM 6794]